MKQLIAQLIDEYGISEFEANTIIKSIKQKIKQPKAYIKNNAIKKTLPLIIYNYEATL